MKFSAKFTAAKNAAAKADQLAREARNTTAVKAGPLHLKAAKLYKQAAEGAWDAHSLAQKDEAAERAADAHTRWTLAAQAQHDMAREAEMLAFA